MGERHVWAGRGTLRAPRRSRPAACSLQRRFTTAGRISRESGTLRLGEAGGGGRVGMAPAGFHENAALSPEEAVGSGRRGGRRGAETCKSCVRLFHAPGKPCVPAPRSLSTPIESEGSWALAEEKGMYVIRRRLAILKPDSSSEVRSWSQACSVRPAAGMAGINWIINTWIMDYSKPRLRTRRLSISMKYGPM